MLPPSGLSRRALVVSAAVAAVASAPTAVARKRKPPPLASYSVTIREVSAFVSGSDRAVEVQFGGVIYHPESNQLFDWDGTIDVAPTLNAKAARKALIRQLQDWAQLGLQLQGEDVPADRIEVILI
jgi:hypothetical protein